MSVCLVTGGAGFIGSHLVRSLLHRGDTVRVLDNFSTGRRANLQGVSGPVDIIEGDLRSADDLRAALQGVERVYHLAAFVSVPQSMLEPQACFEINEQGTYSLLLQARAAGVRKVVLASSAAVYGEPERLPLDESMPLRPQSPYAASKWMNEVYAGLFTRAMGLPVASLRFFNVFGPRQSPTSAYAAAVPIFIRRMLDGKAPVVNGDGQQVRDFVFVSDVVRAIMLSGDSAAADGRIFNICSGQPTSVLDLLAALYRLIPSAPPMQFAEARPGDIYISYASPRWIAERLGFQAQVSLEEGLSRTVASMLAEAAQT